MALHPRLIILCAILLSLVASGAEASFYKSPNSDSVGQSKTAEDGLGLREVRRVGVGLEAAGPLGAYGANIELCFSPEQSFVGGFGGTADFQAFTLQYKRTFADIFGTGSLLPYVNAGYSRWYNTGPGKAGENDPTSGVLTQHFLTADERTSGKFALNLIYPGIGLQWLQTKGDFAGSSIYIEALLLVDLERFVSAPTGTLGYLYYF